MKEIFNQREDWFAEAREFYLDMFISKNDKGHNAEHVDAVYNNAIEIVNKKKYYNLDHRVIFMCVYLHDLFVWKNRKHHHILAAEYVYEKRDIDIFLRNFAGYDIENIANAILEHRSSGSLKTSSEYSEILRIADNGKPDLVSIIKRIYACNNDDMDIATLKEHTYKHLIEKFGPDGYIRKDKQWVKHYEEELVLFDIEFASEEMLKKMISNVISFEVR